MLPPLRLDPLATKVSRMRLTSLLKSQKRALCHFAKVASLLTSYCAA